MNNICQHLGNAQLQLEGWETVNNTDGPIMGFSEGGPAVMGARPAGAAL